MTKLGLKQINNATLMTSEPANLKELQMISDYVTFGYPAKKVVIELVKKRGHMKVETKRVPLNDNA